MNWKNSPQVKDYFLTGSREICSPPVMNTDIDYCLLVSKSDFIFFRTILAQNGWEQGGSYVYMENNCSFSFRREDINLIVITDPTEFKKWRTATQLAKRFNLTDKEDRVALFRAIREKDWNTDYSKPSIEEWI